MKVMQYYLLSALLLASSAYSLTSDPLALTDAEMKSFEKVFS